MSNNNIALTASMRSNLLSLQNTQSLMNKTQDRLSTGYKVNSAMDNPSSYFTAQALNSRANDLSSLLDSIGQAISTLEVADEGITTLQDFVEQAKSIANSARDTSNVSASSTSTVKFNPDTLRSDLVTNQVNGLTPGNSSMTIRLGDATKLDGLTNVSEETALSNLGIGTTGASDIGTLSIDGKAYTIDASGTTKQMTNVQSYGEKSVLKITDASDLTNAKVEDAAGNKYTLDLSGVAGATTTSTQIRVKAGAEGGIKATVAEDGKTTWELSDKDAWGVPTEKSKTSTWVAGAKFEVDVTNGKFWGVGGSAAGTAETTAMGKTSIGSVALADGDVIKAVDDYAVTYKGDEFDNYTVQNLESAFDTSFAGAVIDRQTLSQTAVNFSTDMASAGASHTYAADTVFKFVSYAAGTLTLEDTNSNQVTISNVTDVGFSELAAPAGGNYDLVKINSELRITESSGNYVADANVSQGLFKDALVIKKDETGGAGTAWAADALNANDPTITPAAISTPVATLDLTGAARDIKGTYTYNVDSSAGGAAVTFTLSEVDATAGTATLTDADGNVFKNVTVNGVDASSKELTIAAAANKKLVLSKAENDVVVAQDGANGRFDFTGETLGTTGTAPAVGSATMVQANTVFIDNGGTVGDMAETLQNMIGNTRLSVSVEDSNLKLKTLDTSSLEVKDGSVLGTNGTANGVGFATAFGLDVGQTIKLDASDTAESLRQKVEQMSRNMRDGRSVTAEFDTNGHMIIKSSEGDDMVISGELADRLGVSGKATNGANERAIYSQQFNNVLTQIDQLVQDTSYKGINLLKGDNLTVNFNESRTSTIELKGVNFDATGLGFTQAVNEWRTNANIDKSLEQITKATSMLRAQASEFGQNLSTVQIREDFTKNMINNLQSGADKLTLADMNEEAANMLALQTRQQLGVNSLSLASQASQSVLKLF